MQSLPSISIGIKKAFDDISKLVSAGLVDVVELLLVPFSLG
jgi:hypothetical protein